MVCVVWHPYTNRGRQYVNSKQIYQLSYIISIYKYDQPPYIIFIHRPHLQVTFSIFIYYIALSSTYHYHFTTKCWFFLSSLSPMMNPIFIHIHLPMHIHLRWELHLSSLLNRYTIHVIQIPPYDLRFSAIHRQCHMYDDRDYNGFSMWRGRLRTWTTRRCDKGGSKDLKCMRGFY